MNKTSLALILVALPSLVALTQNVEARGDRHGKGDAGAFLSKLDLTPEQQEALTKLRKEKKSLTKSLREQKKSLHEKLETAFKSDAADDALKSLHQELAAVKAQLDAVRFGNLLEIRKVLTPEQRAKFQELKVKKGKRGKWDRDDKDDDDSQ